jgi:hypothetical protein
MCWVGSWDAAGEVRSSGSKTAVVVQPTLSSSQHGEGVVLLSEDFSRLSRHPVSKEPRNPVLPGAAPLEALGSQHPSGRTGVG